MAHKYIKMFKAFREKQTKTTMRQACVTIRVATVKTSNATTCWGSCWGSCWGCCEKLDHASTAAGTYSGYNGAVTLENSSAVS